MFIIMPYTFYQVNGDIIDQFNVILMCDESYFIVFPGKREEDNIHQSIEIKYY